MIEPGEYEIRVEPEAIKVVDPEPSPQFSQQGSRNESQEYRVGEFGASTHTRVGGCEVTAIRRHAQRRLHQGLLAH